MLCSPSFRPLLLLSPSSPLWELLAQCALVVLLHKLLGPGHLPVHCVFKCDNLAAEAASWKGLSMARGQHSEIIYALSTVLPGLGLH